MKRLFLVLSFFLIVAAALIGIDSIYTSRVNQDYDDRIGGVLAPEKNQGLILQRKAIDSKDNILIYGSSELGSLLDEPFNPANFFEGKKDGFQVNLIGRGYCQSLIHAMNIGALGKSLQHNKIVFIVSPQWFLWSIDPNNFQSNFSELHFYAFMFNNDIDKSLKIAFAERIDYLTNNNPNLIPINKYCELYKKDTSISRFLLRILMPYYKFKYYLLSTKDKINTYRLLKTCDKVDINTSDNRVTFDWQKERNVAVSFAQREANNNDFYLKNDYYDTYIRKDLESFKGSYSEMSFLYGSEYEDFTLFLDICTNLQISPLIVSVPVNGKWYDYCGSDNNDRQCYYTEISQMVQSSNFKLVDYSTNEYDPYFLKDVMHIGWKGWIFFNEAIDDYYHSND